jgi:hypothetical protein
LPLRFAEVVWGDGEKTHRKIHSLETTREFGNIRIEIDVDAPNWRWARIAVWDIAGNGAFANPVRGADFSLRGTSVPPTKTLKPRAD